VDRLLGAAYEWTLGNGNLGAHAGYQYRSKTHVATTLIFPVESPSVQPAYDILDLGVSYTLSGGAWRFAVEGKNILDEEYRVAGYEFGTVPVQGAPQIGFYGPPRTVSVTASYRY
jgi:iron complex outermembrane receptor protein